MVAAIALFFVGIGAVGAGFGQTVENAHLHLGLMPWVLIGALGWAVVIGSFVVVKGD
jgi:hypothetical protein